MSDTLSVLIPVPISCGAVCRCQPPATKGGRRLPLDHGVTVALVEIARTCPACGSQRSAPQAIRRHYSPGSYALGYHVWSCRCSGWLYADIAAEAKLGRPIIATTPTGPVEVGRFVKSGEWPDPPRTVEEVAAYMEARGLGQAA